MQFLQRAEELHHLVVVLGFKLLDDVQVRCLGRRHVGMTQPLGNRGHGDPSIQ